MGNFPVFTSFIEKMEINRIYPLEIAEIQLKSQYFPVSFSLYAASKLDENER